MSVATSYARALYETASDRHVTPEGLKEIEGQLEKVVSLVESEKDIRVVLCGPITTAKEKVAVVEALGKTYKLEENLVRFLSLLAKKGRIKLLGSIRDAFNTVRLTAEGGVSGKLVSAEPMSDADVASLAKAFSQKLGKHVAFRVSVDPSLLAGMRVTVNGVTYDGTLRSQLFQLRDCFMAGQAGQA